MREFEPIFPGIERLRVPFDVDKTSVFSLCAGDGGTILADCAATEADVRTVILPALNNIGKTPDRIFVSHDHGDHSGGLPYLMDAFPEAQLLTGCRRLADRYPGRSRLLSDGDVISPRWAARALPGHTKDLTGLFDMETGTLLSFDGLQLYGVCKWGLGLDDAALYRKTLSRGAGAKEIQNIVASHEYEDLGDTAMGSDAVRAYFDRCSEALRQTERFVRESGLRDAAALAEKYAREVSAPPIAQYSFDAIMKGMRL